MCVFFYKTRLNIHIYKSCAFVLHSHIDVCLWLCVCLGAGKKVLKRCCSDADDAIAAHTVNSHTVRARKRKNDVGEVEREGSECFPLELGVMQEEGIEMGREQS